ncbi:MAG TPA: hypothetical protein VIV40_35615 [Kofleriaceae bacterium]
MAHDITAIVIADPFDAEVAKTLDLVAVPLSWPLTLFHIDHYYTAYWGAVRGHTKQLDVPSEFPGEFPREGIVAQLVAELTGLPAARFAIIQTEYFGGVGDQWACAFAGEHRKTHASATINDALRTLGVVRQGGMDEFDTVGLGEHRSPPAYLHRYVDLCDELGV